MDLLGSILNSMDKPPTASEREKKAAKEMKDRLEREQALEQKKKDRFIQKVLKQIEDFLANDDKSLKFDPTDKVYRSLIHDVATTAGLVTYSFGSEDDETKHVVGYKKEYAPTEEELVYMRRGVPVPSSITETPCSSRSNPIPAPAVSNNPSKPPVQDYRQKYKHLIDTEIAEPSAIKTQPERKFGFVPSANKRDLRSIEETLQDIRSKKKMKLTEEDESPAATNS